MIIHTLRNVYAAAVTKDYRNDDEDADDDHDNDDDDDEDNDPGDSGDLRGTQGI